MKDIRWVPIYMLCMHDSIHVFRNDPRTSQCTHVTFVSTVYKEHLHLHKTYTYPTSSSFHSILSSVLACLIAVLKTIK